MNSVQEITAPQLIDELTYRSFAANRDLGMSAEAYARLIKIDAEAFEARYQRERGKPIAPMVVNVAALDQVTGGAVSYREPIDKVCGVCGAKHCHGHPQERGVGR